MTITCPCAACGVRCICKVYLLLKRHLETEKLMKGICYDITPILGSLAE